MNTETSPTLLIFCTFGLLFCGLIVLTWGKKLPGKGSWLIWTGILALLVGIGFDAGIFLKEAFKIKVWMSGWVWAKDEVGAITVGVYQDSLSLAMSALAAIVSGALLINYNSLSQDKSSERTHAALAISTAGVTLAWNSLTPWLVLTGIILTVIGGFVSMGSRWDSNPESYIAVRFAWERVSGCLLAFLGACVLASSRSAMVLNNPDVWLPNADNLTSTWIGFTLLVIGLFAQMQPFPLLGLVVTDSEIASPIRTLLIQLFPAWAAFPLLLRLEPSLINLGLFPAFGWFALCSSMLAVFSGLLQKKWRLGLGSWLAAGFSLCCAFLSFSGPVPAMGMLIGISLGAMILSTSASALEEQVDQKSGGGKSAIWIKIAAFCGMAAGTGVLGFVSANAGLRWISQAVNLPGIVAAFLFAMFMFVLLGWKLAWNVVRIPSDAKSSQSNTSKSSNPGFSLSWSVTVSLVIWILLSLGVVWNGTATGGILLGDPDQLWTSLFAHFFGSKIGEFPNADDFITASSLYWGAIIIAFATAYWTSGRAEDQWLNLASAMPKTSRFLAGGYGVDTLFRKVNFGLVWFGRAAEKIIDEKIWSEWVPTNLAKVIKTVSKTMTQLDMQISSSLGVGLKKLVDVPAKSLQLIQTGDLRWYLFFAVASGFALLLHFLRI